MTSPELDALIVEHLADLDRSAARIEGIQRTVFSAMGRKAEDWAKKHGWANDFRYPEGGWDEWENRVAPEDWRVPGSASEDDRFFAWFELAVGAGDTETGKDGEDWFYLTRLCRAGVGQLGLVFRQEGLVKPRQWKQAFHGPERLVDMVSGTRFIADARPSFFLPFASDATSLAAALRDEDPEAALSFFDTALDALLAAKPAFDRVIARLKASGVGRQGL